MPHYTYSQRPTYSTLEYYNSILKEHNLESNYTIEYNRIQKQPIAIPKGLTPECRSNKYIYYKFKNSKPIMVAGSINEQYNSELNVSSMPAPQCYQNITETSCNNNNQCKWAPRFNHNLEGSSNSYMTTDDANNICCNKELYDSTSKTCQLPPLVGNWYYQYGQLCNGATWPQRMYAGKPPDAMYTCSSGCYLDTELGKLYINNRPGIKKLGAYLRDNSVNAAFYLGNGFLPIKTNPLNEHDKQYDYFFNWFGAWHEYTYRKGDYEDWEKYPSEAYSAPIPATDHPGMNPTRWDQMMTNLNKTSFDTHPYQIINFGGWGCCASKDPSDSCKISQKPAIQRVTFCPEPSSTILPSSRPNAIWDISAIDDLPSKDDILKWGFNGISIDIEGVWGNINDEPYNGDLKKWKSHHPGVSINPPDLSCTDPKHNNIDISCSYNGNPQPKTMYRVVENSQNEFNYKMTSDEAKKFGQALNKKLKTYNGLLRFLVLQGNGLSESHGGMEWLNDVSANNYEYIIPMYYSNINDTGSKVNELSSNTMPSDISNTWRQYNITPDKIILGYSLGNQATSVQDDKTACNPLSTGGSGSCPAQNSSGLPFISTCRTEGDKPNNWLNKEILAKAYGGVTNWAFYGGIIKGW